MRRWPVLLALSACIQSQPLQLPTDSTAGSVLIAIRGSDARIHIYAFERSRVPPFAIGDEELYVLLYEVELAALGLTAGEQMTPEPARARPFPPGYAAFRADESRTAWTELTAGEVEGQLGTRVLVEVSPCESSGGCIRRREEPNFNDSHEYCELPCAEPSAPAAPNPPAPAELPDFGACPTGWLTRSSLAGDASYCEPRPSETCGAGSIQFLGDAGCAPIGSSCAADGWPASLPSGRTVHYVRPGGGGDGSSKSAPLGTIAQALAVAGPSDVVALAVGTHAGGVVLDRSVSLIGACVDTVISGGSPGVGVPPGAGVELRDLTIEAAGDGLLVDGTATLGGVSILGGAYGALVHGTLIARELVIRDASESGIMASGGASVRVRRGYFSDNVGVGVRLEDQSMGRLDDVVIRGTLVRAGNAFETKGYGVLSRYSSKVYLTRVLLERNRANAISTWYSSTASVTYAVDRDGLGQYSFDVDTEAVAQASYFVALGAVGGAVWAFRNGNATITDAYVLASGSGFLARQGGRINAERALFEDNRGVAVESSGGGSVALRNVVIRDQAINASGTGQGILVNGGAVTGAQIQIVRATGAGIDVNDNSGASASATFTDVTIAGVRSRDPTRLHSDCDSDGTSFRVSGSGEVSLTRAAIEGGERGVGIDSIDMHELTDLHIRAALVTGFCARDGVYLVDRMRIEDTSGIGMVLDGAYAETSNLTIAGTKRGNALNERFDGDAVFLTGTNNVMSVRISTLPLTVFSLSDNEARGVHLDNASEASLSDGRIEGSPVGIEVNQPSFNAATLYENVIFRNNVQNVLVKF